MPLQARERTQAHAVAAAAEAALQECTRNFEQQIAEVEKSTQSSLAEQGAELNALRRLLKLRTQQLASMRKAKRATLCGADLPLLEEQPIFQFPVHSLVTC